MNLRDPTIEIILDPEKNCCVCFRDLEILTKDNIDLKLNDLKKEFFIDNSIPNDILVKSVCNIHYICIKCLKNLVNNYENHMININNSHIYCPYPFNDCVTKIGFKNIFDHNLIKKICTEKEWNDYQNHIEKYAFPGYIIEKCPVITCKTDILIKVEEIKNTPIGDLIIRCSQNSKCFKKFCYYCKVYISYYSNTCYDCKTAHENENPNVYNYYINKIEENNNNSGQSNDNEQNIENEQEGEENENENENSDWGSDKSIEQKNNYKESAYLYLNKELTENIVLKQINDLLLDINNYMICSICKRSLYKTERCNGLSHHNIERCYACGRIGFLVKGLIEHWNSNGVGGCFRFDSDNYVKENIPEYKCSDILCSNHEIGDCKIPEHSIGIYKLEKTRIKSYIYHIIKSLLPELTLQICDKLYDIYKNDDKILDLLPYKQTFLILQKYKKRYKDFSEEIVYLKLNIKFPEEIDDFFINKNYSISADEYIAKYIKYENQNTNRNTNLFLDLIDADTTPLLQNNEEINIIDTVDITDLSDIINNPIYRSSGTIDAVDTMNIIDEYDNRYYDNLDSFSFTNSDTFNYIPIDNIVEEIIVNYYNREDESSDDE